LAHFLCPDVRIGYGWKYPSVCPPTQELACCSLLPHFV
jgi:hypothetical protein